MKSTVFVSGWLRHGRVAVLAALIAGLSIGPLLAQADLYDAQRPVLQEIAGRIMKLQARYSQLADFNPHTSICGDQIVYCRRTRSVPNPEYAALKAAQEAEKKARPGGLRMRIPDTITVYDAPDGICLTVRLVSRRELEMGQRVWIPRYWIKGWAVESRVSGAPGPKLGNLSSDLDAILTEMSDKTTK